MRSIAQIFQEHKNPVSKTKKVSSTNPVVASKSKYRNKRVVIDGINFDSTGEAYCWLDLKDRMNRGEFREVKRQVRFPLVVNGIQISNYDADFVTLDYSGTYTVIDYKSTFTQTLQLYQLKKKLMKALYCIDIVEYVKK